MTDKTTAARLAAALEALTERAFKRCLFPDEVREAFGALDQFKEDNLGSTFSRFCDEPADFDAADEDELTEVIQEVINAEQT